MKLEFSWHASLELSGYNVMQKVENNVIHPTFLKPEMKTIQDNFAICGIRNKEISFELTFGIEVELLSV